LVPDASFAGWLTQATGQLPAKVSLVGEAILLVVVAAYETRAEAVNGFYDMYLLS
jgi:hypothetical protein